MKILLTRSQQDFFDQFIQNETSIAENQVEQFNQQSEKTLLISNKLLIIIIACVFIILIATLLTVYFIKDQIKDFTNRMGIGQRGSVIHQFHPEVLLHSSIREQTSSYNPTVNEGGKREQISSSNQRSQSTINLSLYH